MTATPDPERPVAPADQPFTELRGSTGVLLLHGYSGSPGELRPLGQALAGAGYSVHAPLLAGHGGLPDALHGVRWEDWLASAEAGLEQLRASCRRVFLCGFSAGGLLALRLAVSHALAGLIALAPALRLRGGALLPVAGLLQHVMPWYYPLARANFGDPAVRAAVLARAPDANLDDPAVVAGIRKAARVPIGSLYQLARLQRAVVRDLPRVQLPTLIMQGRRDETVDPQSAALVAERIGSRDKRLIWFDHSGHQLPREREREQVNAAALEWLGQRS